MSDFPDYLNISADDLGKGTPVKVRVLSDMASIGRDVAGAMCTYDNFAMFGTSSYVSSLWLGALRAALFWPSRACCARLISSLS